MAVLITKPPLIDGFHDTVILGLSVESVPWAMAPKIVAPRVVAPPPKRPAAAKAEAAQPGVTSKAAQPSEAPPESQLEAENAEILEMAAREISAAMGKVGSGGAPRTEDRRSARPDRLRREHSQAMERMGVRLS